MKMGKRLLAFLLAATLTIGVAACGSNTGSKSGSGTMEESKSLTGTSVQPSEKKADGEVVKLKFMLVAGNDEMPAWSGITDSFNKSNPDIQVKLEQLPGGWNEYNQKMTALIAAGTPPDIGRMGASFMPQYISKGQLEDLTEYVNTGLNMADYYENAFKEASYEGRMYGVPCGIYTMALYFNKKMFDAAGVEYPSLDWNKPWSMEQLQEAARKLTKGTGATKQYGFLCSIHPERSCTFVFSNGGNFMNDAKTESTMNTEPVTKAYKLLQDMIYVDKTSPSPAQLKTMPSDQMFTSDRLAMMIDGAWNMPSIAKKEGFQFGVAPVPKGMSSATTVNFLDQYVIYKGSKHVAEAWKVVQSFISTDAENILVDKKIGGIPVLKTVAEARKADMFNPLTPEEKDVWFNSVDHSKSMPFTANWAEIMDKTMKTIDLVGLNQMPAVQAMDKVKADIDPLLKK